MGDMLTQEEINALLSGGDLDSSGDTGSNDSVLGQDELDALFSEASSDVLESTRTESPDLDNALTDEEKDILGEIGNISMGTSATTLFTLLNSQKVQITTPNVSIRNWDVLSSGYDRPCVGIKVNYIEGITGSNILILKERDVKIISDLMMGGTGNVPEVVKVDDMDLSAIGEAMNQMVGSSSTSLSSIIKRKIDIDTPKAMILNFDSDNFFEQTGFKKDDILACVSFKMEIGELIDSEITQIIPIDFAKDMVSKMMEEFKNGGAGSTESQAAAPPQAAPPQPMPPQQPAAYAPPPPGYPAPGGYPPQPEGYPPQPAYAGPPPMGYPPQGAPYPPPGAYPPQPAYYGPPPPGYQQPMNVNAQAAQFQPLNVQDLAQQKENIDIIMDVALEVTVELGRTSRKIREILEFAPGTIVDLDKLAGEPIDILVNGKFVATGEVVVVDENFAVRVTDIISADKRI